MSKLIVEMEMPSCCARCPLSERTTAFDQKDDKEVVGYMCDLERSFFMKEDDAAKMRAYGCRICGVLPEQHGDLIDRDVAFDYINRLICDGCNAETESDCEACIKKGIDEVLYFVKPTIAAERKDDGK